MPCINSLTTFTWKKEIANSNAAAMGKRHQYPIQEEQFFIDCLEYVNLCCPMDCGCRSLGGDKVWVLKRDLNFGVFLTHYANLWVLGSAGFIRNVYTKGVHPGGRSKNAISLMRYINSKWNNWDGKGSSLPQMSNNHRMSIFCDRAHDAIGAIQRQISRNVADSTGVYTSKFLSQLFPDIVVPYDTESAKRMVRCGYVPTQLGSGSVKSETVRFLHSNGINAAAFRGFDNARNVYWPYRGIRVAKTGLPTTYSRVIDKIFYR